MDDIPNIVTDPIFNGLYKLLQGMGAIVRWLFFLGNCPPEKIQNDRHLNTFVAVVIIASGIGLAYLINY